MTNRQENKRSMYLAVRELLGLRASNFSSFAVYTGYLARFDQAITDIGINSEKQLTDKTGDRATKEEVQAELVAKASHAAKIEIGYARSVSDQTLLNRAKANAAKLLNAADTILSDTVNLIVADARTYETALAGFGMTEAMVSELEATLEEYNEWTPKPKVGISEKKAATKNLKESFGSADGALVDIDALVEIIKLNNPTFYTEYKSARKISETGTGKLAMRCKVKSAANGQGLEGVEVRIEQNPGQVFPIGTPVFEPIVRLTAKGGGFVIKSLPQGEYYLSVKHPGFVEMQKVVSKYDGQVCEVEFVLELKSSIV